MDSLASTFNFIYEILEEQGPWKSAIASTIFIGLAPILFLGFIPIAKKNKRGHEMVNQTLLNILVSFAVGGLLGDVFLHLIPHALFPHDHSHGHTHHEEIGLAHDHGHDHDHDHDHDHLHDHAHSHDHDHDHDHIHDHSHEHHHHAEHFHEHDHSDALFVGLLVLVGMLAFFILEKIARIRAGSSGAMSGHSHSHSHTHQATEVFSNTKNPNLRKRKSGKKEKSEEVMEEEEEQTPANVSKISGILNIIADATHNFTDGMAIAASYMAGSRLGLSTTIAVFFHEIPHEVGDYAILIQSGFTKRQAILVQMGTAIGALVGTLVGLAAGDLASSTNASSWILPITAGGFIYIATVGVLPGLLQNPSVKETILEIIAMGVGVGMMVLIALYE